MTPLTKEDLFSLEKTPEQNLKKLNELLIQYEDKTDRDTIKTSHTHYCKLFTVVAKKLDREKKEKEKPTVKFKVS